MSAQLEVIQKILQKNASAAATIAHQKFVPGAGKIYGVRMPVLNVLAKQFKQCGFELAEELWESGAFEEKILAGKMLGKIAKQNPEKTLQLIEQFSNQTSNWAECDTIGMQSIKPILKIHRKEIFALSKKLSMSKNLWQRRLSLVLVEWYTRDKTCHAEINKLFNALENDEEYYVRKAVTWIKNNFAKKK